MKTKTKTTRPSESRGRRVSHEDCPVCACNVHGRVTVALAYLNTGHIAKAKQELKMLLPLVEP